MQKDTETSPKKLVIYTVLTGSKEPLGNPLEFLQTAETDLEIAFACITDNPDFKSDIWRFLPIDQRTLVAPADKLSRHPKCNPHLYFPDFEYSLFIDNIVKFKRLPTSADLTENNLSGGEGYIFKVFPHFHRKYLQEEALAIVSLKYDSFENISRQLDFYQSVMPLEKIEPLTTGTVLLRKHHHPLLKDFGQLWWQQILQFSKRDQMSLDFCIKHLGVTLSYFDGIKNDNEFIHKPNSMTGRVRSSFDEKKYQWIHRNNAEAVASPKQHFLRHGALNHERYEKPSEVFEFSCFLADSSLGNVVPPRRNLSSSFFDFFAMNCPQVQDAMLLVFETSSEAGVGFNERESLPALSALKKMSKTLGVQSSVSTQVINADEFKFDVRMKAENVSGFDMLVVLGYPIQQIVHLDKLLEKLISEQATHLRILFDGHLPFKVLGHIFAQFSEYADIEKFEVSNSWHDSIGVEITNSMITIKLVKKSKENESLSL